MAAQERAHLLGERGFLGGEPEMHGEERKHLRSPLVKHWHWGKLRSKLTQCGTSLTAGAIIA